jgi:parallel beta-helix repeat protein
MTQKTGINLSAIFSKLKWWQATIMIVSILLAGALFVHEGGQLSMNFDVQAQITTIENRLDIPVNSTLSAFQKSNTYLVIPHSAGAALMNSDGYLKEFLTNYTQVIDDGLNNASIAGGSVYVQAGAYSASGVIVPNNTRLVLEIGATGITYTVAPSATCIIDDFNSGFFAYYISGTLYSLFNYAAGTLLIPTINFTTINWNGQNRTDIFAYPQESLASVIAWTDGTNFYSKNCTTGQVSSSISANSTIGNALGNMTSGGLLFIKAGSYPNIWNLTIVNSGTTVRGEGPSTDLIMQANVTTDPSCGFLIKASNCSIENLQIDGNGPTVYPQNVNIFGVLVLGTTTATINGDSVRNCYIHDCDEGSTHIQAGYGAGAVFEYERYGAIIGNNFVNCGHWGAAIVYNGTNTLIEGNTLFNCYESIEIHSNVGYTNFNTISGNSINYAKKHGIILDVSSYNLVEENTICYCGWGGSFDAKGGTGIRDTGCFNNIFGNTVIFSGESGIYGGSNTTITGNFVGASSQNTNNTWPNIALFEFDLAFGNIVRIGSLTAFGPTLTKGPNYGIYIPSYAINKTNVVQGNDVRGSGFLGGFGEAYPGQAYVVKDNIGYNPIGAIVNPISGNTFSLINAGNNATWTSGVIYTNYESPKTLYISGGTTVTLVIDGQIVASAVATLTLTTIRLEPLDTFNCTASALPTIVVIGQ